jgi:hypothetical protein
MREHDVSIDCVPAFVEIVLDERNPLLFLRREELLLWVARRMAFGISPRGDTIEVVLT